MKAAIYCRLSEEDRDKQSHADVSGSIQNQKAMLLQYAEGQGWAVYRVYSDDDYAGADRRRPAFNQLLKDAEQRRFDVVLCKTQSRFTRELELVEKYIHGLFPAWGIRFVSIVDNADTANKGNKKSRQINGLVNEWYLEDMSDNIRSVLDNRRENGFHIGAFAPYGYRKDPMAKGHLIVDAQAAAVVREVFSLYAQGCGKTAIARMLNDRGIPNPTEYKRLQGLRYRNPKSRNSTLWKYFAIADMLGNEVYIGNLVQGRYGSVSYKTKQNKPRPRNQWYKVEGTHEPIIDRALWERVQGLRAAHAKPLQTGTIGLFARKARCAYCGYVMRSSKTNGRYYLKCPNRHVEKDACPGGFIAVDALERAVLIELGRLTEEYLDREEMERKIQCCTGMQERRKQLQDDLTAYRKKIEEYTKGMRTLYMDKVKGILSESDYIALAEDFAKEKQRFECMCTEGEQQLAELEAQSAADRRQGQIDRYTSPEHLTREMVDSMIDHVMVGKRAKGTNEVSVEIYWQF